MRKIKFRVWDTQLKEFSTDWTNRDPFLCLTTGDLFFYERADIFNQTGPDIICQDHDSRFVLQQYTGINDIHGNEIYEGDTIKDSLWSVSDAKVIFTHGTFGFRDGDLRFVPLCELTEPEIINERITNER